MKEGISAKTYTIFIAVTVGLVLGVVAWLLKLCIHSVSNLLTSSLHIGHANLLLLLIPLAGIMLTGIYQRYIIHRNIEHGTEQIMSRLHQQQYNIGTKLLYAPIVASTLTLGFGGSAGSEGPIATVGGAVGSNVGRWFKMTPQQMRIMIGCGAGAAIAAIFKAPIGGVMFTLEVLGLELTTVSVMALVIACVTSALTAYVLSGCTYDIHYIQAISFDTHIMPWVLLLGLLCGLYSAYYAWVMQRGRKCYEAIKSPWLRNLASGSILAILVFTFPSLYGEGYSVLSHLINGHDAVLLHDSMFYTVDADAWLMIAIAGGILFCKPHAACASNSGGGVAGDFAPTLFAGAIAGYLFAMLLNTGCGLDLPVSNFAYIGMAAVMAGAVRAPFMALFLTAEMADGYQFLLPLAVAAVISYLVVRYLPRVRSVV